MSKLGYSALTSILLVIQAVMSPAYGVEESLDLEKYEQEPTYYGCLPMSFDKMENEVGKLFFKVQLKGYCMPFYENSNQPSNYSWKLMTAIITYDYDTKKVTERISSSDWLAVENQGVCPRNPWVDEVTCHVPDVKNYSGIKLAGPFPLSAQGIRSELRKAFLTWETSKMTDKEMANWDPFEPKGTKEIAIVQPSIVTEIAGNAPNFDLIFKASSTSTPKPGWAVQLEWARIDPAKDPSIELDGHWVLNTPPTAPMQLPWAQKFQLQQNLDPYGTKTHKISRAGFKPGMYAVRAKIKTSSNKTWTDWRTFFVGDASFDISRLQAAYGATKKGKVSLMKIGPTKIETMSTESAKKLLALPTTRIGSATIGSNAMKLEPGANQVNKIKPLTKMKTMQGQAPKGVDTKLGGKRVAKTVIMPLKKPSLWINTSKGLAMTTSPQLNKPFGISVPLINLGSAANGNGSTNKITVKATCVPLSGGACKANLSLPVPVIHPGKSKSWGNLHGMGMFTASKPGKYRVSVSITPANKPKKGVGAGYTQIWSKDFTIKSVTIKPGMPKAGTTKQQIKIPVLSN
jgi:hypothetical protein